ncbi:MAG: C-terminal helicase domain-containing protein [Pelodictyon phaeoclathratiforme]
MALKVFLKRGQSHRGRSTGRLCLRRREALENEGLLDKIAVNVHPIPDARPGTYTGAVFQGIGLMTNHPFELAYQAAESFVSELSKRTKGAQLLQSIFLQRICSSFESGKLTVTRMLKKQLNEHDDDDIQKVERSVLETLTEAEISYLHIILEELSRSEAVDPKLRAVKWFLQHFQSEGKSWNEWGCIVFSQYYDTVNWVALELAKLFPEQIVAVYAGAGKSGLYRGDQFVSINRDSIKKMVKERELFLVVATDAACEGLNLQTLGTLINIDLPWNPARLEQRLGRIKRFGQARKSVDMLNLTYHATRDEDVYAKISERMKERYDIFGGLPDCIEDEWIDNIEGFVRLADTHLHMRKQVENIFETTWGSAIKSEDDRWEECARVLSQKDINAVMSKPWGKRG